MGLNIEWPYFRRAREYHLYDDTGKRYLDLWQNDGRAVMGHRPGKFSQYFKNSISRGMWADYPCPKIQRLSTLLKKMFPEYKNIAFFRNRERAMDSLNTPSPSDPLRNPNATVLDWRPFMPDHPTGETLFLRLPVAGLLETQVVLSLKPLPEGEAISPIIIEGLIRLFHDLENWSRTKPQWRSLPDQAGRQQGPYYSWHKKPAQYSLLAESALKKGIVLPPDPKYPLMIPREMSDHEYKTISSILEEALSTPNSSSPQL